MKSQDLEDRFIDFAARVIQLEDKFKYCIASFTLKKQLIRSASAVALNYSESRAAESIKDFVHKLSLSLKELRETDANLKLIQRSGLNSDQDEINLLIDESNVLISILVSSIRTTQNKK